MPVFITSLKLHGSKTSNKGELCNPKKSVMIYIDNHYTTSDYLLHNLQNHDL